MVRGVWTLLVTALSPDTITVCWPYGCPPGWYAAGYVYREVCGYDFDQRSNATTCERVPKESR